MFVSRYRLVPSTFDTVITGDGPSPVIIRSTGATVNIPIMLNAKPVNQEDVVEKDFVSIEVEKVINPIVDYERVRLTPTNIDDVILDEVRYSIHFNSSPTYPTVSYYGDIGYIYDDVKFRKNKFTNSFLKLSFYDSDVTTDQRLISLITLFPRITTDEIGVDGLPLPINLLPIRFRVTDPIKNPEGVSEGFYLYHFKDEVLSDLPKELFMRGTFNNAKTGEIINLITVPTALEITELVNKLHTKYILKRNNDGYFYEIDLNYSSNVSVTNGVLDINLYEIQVL
jgi:hypothetical protein